jgi:4a-hydroxytetrahydrobiopterin dehydratase
VSTLARRKCLPCEGGIPPLKGRRLAAIARELGGGWRIVRAGAPATKRLSKEWRFPDFARALAFVDAIGELAEREGHHPDLELSWGRVGATIFTHAVGGLTASDFVLAAMIDDLPLPGAPRARRRPRPR